MLPISLCWLEIFRIKPPEDQKRLFEKKLFLRIDWQRFTRKKLPKNDRNITTPHLLLKQSRCIYSGIARSYETSAQGEISCFDNCKGRVNKDKNIESEERTNRSDTAKWTQSQNQITNSLAQRSLRVQCTNSGILDSSEELFNPIKFKPRDPAGSALTLTMDSKIMICTMDSKNRYVGKIVEMPHCRHSCVTVVT